jgi:hypothetical protein
MRPRKFFRFFQKKYKTPSIKQKNKQKLSMTSFLTTTGQVSFNNITKNVVNEVLAEKSTAMRAFFRLVLPYISEHKALSTSFFYYVLFWCIINLYTNTLFEKIDPKEGTDKSSVRVILNLFFGENVVSLWYGPEKLLKKNKDVKKTALISNHVLKKIAKQTDNSGNVFYNFTHPNFFQTWFNYRLFKYFQTSVRIGFVKGKTFFL